MRKILFVMPALYGGGAEKSLVNLLNLIDYKKYAVDLLLFKQEGLFLTQIPKEVRLLPLTVSLRYAYKIDMGMFGSLSGFKTGMLRLLGTVVCKVFYKEKAGQQRWVKCYKHCLPNLEGNYDIAVGFLEGEASQPPSCIPAFFSRTASKRFTLLKSIPTVVRLGILKLVGETNA